jgi:hypothetical protein
MGVRAKAVNREIDGVQGNKDMVGDMLRKSVPIAISSLAAITAIAFAASAAIRPEGNRGRTNYSSVVTKAAEGRGAIPTSIRSFAVTSPHVNIAKPNAMKGTYATTMKAPTTATSQSAAHVVIGSYPVSIGNLHADIKVVRVGDGCVITVGVANNKGAAPNANVANATPREMPCKEALVQARRSANEISRVAF